MTTATIDRLYSLPSVIGTRPMGATWSADGKHLAFLWNAEGMPFRDLWMHDIACGVTERVTDLERDFAALTPAGIREVALTSAGAFLSLGDHLLRLNGAEARPVATAPGRVTQLARSPDGSALAFVAGGSLYLAEGDAPPHPLLEGGERRYVESFAFAPDGQSIAAVMADDGKVREIEIAYDAGGVAHRERFTRAFPGDTLTERRLAVIDTTDGRVRWCDRPEAQDAIWDYGLSHDGARLFVSSSDLSIKHHSVFVFDLATGARSLAHAAHDPVKIRPDWRCAFAPDGTLILATDVFDGFNHLYRISEATAPEPLTSGAWEIADLAIAPDGTPWFTANLPHPAERQVFRADAPDQPVSRAKGTHAPVFSPDFRFMADLWSDDATPAELLLQDLTTGRVAQLTRSPLPDFAEIAWGEVIYLPFTSRLDGAALMARVTLPPGHDATRPAAMIIGSVYSDGLVNQWGGRAAHPTWGFDQAMAARGYVVVQPEIRGSFGRGRDWNRPMLHSYGSQDIEDIADCVAAMVARGLADPARVAIWGSSYGGLMTLMSLCRKPSLYACGIAGAPATNVFHAYPEQEWIMGPPRGADFPARYQAQSVLWQADGLRDPVMLLHGTRDEVVLYADTMALMERLIEQNADVELVTLPGAGHGWDNEGPAQSRFAFTRMAAFLDRHLTP